ncbi:MAG: TolC family protein [Candidatus Hydrogenedentes bacterium]|nr:TolC family protein [Candidatus Hydrogenedentota bacterium]
MCRIVLFLLPAMLVFAENAAPIDAPQGPLTLRDAVVAALAGNPQLATFSYDIRVGDARMLQARLRPNPELSLEVEDIRLGSGARRESTTRALGLRPNAWLDSLGQLSEGGSFADVLASGLSSDGVSAEFERESQAGSGTFGNVEMTLSLSQLIELGGKRAARIAVAKSERAIAEWDYEVARFEVVGQVVSRFAETLAAQEHLKQERQVVELAEALAETVGRLAEAGSVSPLEGRRARAEAERARIDLTQRERELHQARVRLASTWGSTRPQFAEAVGDITQIVDVPPLDDLLARRDRHPMLKRWASELERRGAVLSLERTKRVPDLTLRLGYRATALNEGNAESISLGTEGVVSSRTNSRGDDWEHSLVLEASIPLPVRDRNQGAILEAELQEEKLGAERRAWDHDLITSVTESYSQAQASAERTESLAARVLPELESTYALTREGYERGKFDFLAVLDAQRAVVNTRMELLESRIAFQLAVADMERLLGAGILAGVDVHELTHRDTQNQRKDTNHE